MVEARIVTVSKNKRTGIYTGKAVRLRGSKSTFTYRMRKGNSPKPNDIALFGSVPGSKTERLGGESKEIWLKRKR